MTATAKVDPSPQARAEAAATKARPLHVLPESWHEPGLRERMALWLHWHPEARKVRVPREKRAGRPRRGGRK